MAEDAEAERLETTAHRREQPQALERPAGEHDRARLGGLGALVAAAALAASFVGWRAAARRPDPRGRVAFMAFAGLSADALFLWLILLGLFQLVDVSACSAG